MPYQARPNRPKLPALLQLVPGVSYSGTSRGVGLSGYRTARPFFRGMGQYVDSSGDVYSDPTGGNYMGNVNDGTYTGPTPSPLPVFAPVTPIQQPVPTLPFAPTAVGSPSPGGSAPISTAPSLFDQTLASLAKSWTGIASNVIAPQVTLQRGPGGTMSYSAPAGSPAASSIPSSIAAIGSSSLLPLALVGVGIFVVFSMLGRK